MRLLKLSFILLPLFFSSCKKNELTDPEEVPYLVNGLLIVNEGLFHQNNSTLSWVDFTTGLVNNQIFEQKTGRQLGDTGNDIGRYGSKIYVIVNVSNTIEVLDAYTGAPIKQINVVGVTRPAEPRFIEFYKGRAFVPSFDGFVEVIDTVSLEIVNRIKVGENPDGCHQVNGKLYVANSGGLSYPDVDSTMSVIDMDTETETHRIVVGKNPRGVISDANGDLYINVQTDALYDANSLWVKVDHQTLTVDTIMPMPVQRYTRVGDKLLLYMSNYAGTTASVVLFDPQTMSVVDNNFIDANLFTTFYGVQYDSIRKQIYCFDAMQYVNMGYLRVFSAQGAHLTDYPIGLNASKLIMFD